MRSTIVLATVMLAAAGSGPGKGQFPDEVSFTTVASRRWRLKG